MSLVICAPIFLLSALSSIERTIHV
jgi:hypothetical protein